MLKLKYDVSHLSDADCILKLRPILALIKTLAAFSTLVTKATGVETGLTGLETAGKDHKAAQAVADAKLTLRLESRAAVEELWRELMHDAEGLGLTAAQYQEALLELQADRSPVGPMPQVANVGAAVGDNPGEVDCNWNAIKRGAPLYIGEYAQDPDGPYTHGYSGKASKCTFSGLTSGVEYWFRFCAKGSAGQGPWSNPARCRAA